MCWLGSVPSYPPSVARVDPDDDSLRRFVVSVYRYDPDRHERRHVVVAAFDNKREFNACIDEVHAEIEARKERGVPVEPNEHVMGVELEPVRRATRVSASSSSMARVVSETQMVTV